MKRHIGILLVALVFIAGCGPSYYWNEKTNRCHDAKTDKFVPSEKCADVRP